MKRSLENLAILLALAGLVAFLPGGEAASRTVVTAIGIGFLVGIGLLAERLYREHWILLAGLSDARRLALFAGIGLMALLIAGYQEIVGLDAGLLVWIALFGAAAGMVIWIVREARRLG